MNDIVLVTADSVRYDHVDEMEFVSSLGSQIGVTAAHYTRPSIAGLLSSSLVSAIESRIAGPTIPNVLSDLGYTCIGLAPTPQTDPAFGFGDGFDEYETFSEGGGDNPLKNRRSWLRESLGRFDSVRRLYRRLVPMEAVLSDIPSDEEVIDMAIERFNEATSPRFLWVHLMESHRPYGTGSQALPKDLDRRAGAAGNEGLLRSVSVTDEEIEEIDGYYRDAIDRVDGEIDRLLTEINADPTFVFTSDHGDELGEEGYFYHQGFRRRVVDTLIEVPVVMDGFDVEPPERFSALDIAPTIVDHAGGDIPEEWHGRRLVDGGSDTMITVAPWHEEATVAIQDGTKKLVAQDADVSLDSDAGRAEASRSDVSPEIEQRLRNLGYTDAG
ncbi:sulfatase-like hydrolase/transferase [Halocatena salina]|uniref:Sulfatase-like hydrolase/transferase n=1 Tax=Halocatena salina TaxID=2934340 RepID=A0A8U0A1G4_9EURY|nr:sulfatase-like hydrolase/transferase [Halocatena salina]UPM42985.1 sulfatase-like hydrolase/transferase [Halocatena salina]